MIIYSASIVLLHWESGVPASSDFPVHSTDGCYSSMDSFLDFCTLCCANHQLWSCATSASVNAVSSKVFDDGTLELVEKKSRKLK